MGTCIGHPKKNVEPNLRAELERVYQEDGCLDRMMVPALVGSKPRRILEETVRDLPALLAASDGLKFGGRSLLNVAICSLGPCDCPCKPLFVACHLGRQDSVKQLLQYGAAVSDDDICHEQGCHLLSLTCHHLDCLELLRRHLSSCLYLGQPFSPPRLTHLARLAECWLKLSNKNVLHGTRKVSGGLYKVDMKVLRSDNPVEVNIMTNNDSILQLYHERWGNQDKRHIKDILKHQLDMKVKLSKELCEACTYGKAHRLKFDNRPKLTKPGELISADVFGAFDKSYRKFRYFVLSSKIMSQSLEMRIPCDKSLKTESGDICVKKKTWRLAFGRLDDPARRCLESLTSERSIAGVVQAERVSEERKMLQKAFKDDCISRSQSGKWHKAFKEGREEVAYEPRSGRPTTARTDENVDRVLEVLRTDRRLSIQQIADTLHRICKCVRVLRCQELLNLIQNELDFLNSVVTGDESWMFEYDPESKKKICIWHTKSSPRPKKARMSKSRIKTMIIVFFDIRGIVQCEFVPQGQTVNSAFYLEVLRRLKRRIARVRTYIKDTVKLHHDNATSHTAFIITNFLARSNTPVIPHPPYSPDLAPCNFFLFPRLKREMKGNIGKPWKTSNTCYNVSEKHSCRGVSGCLSDVANASPQVY
ncbi:hypothetical protein LAZ67_22000734 [Cordylochernes scorpioides]|uniref:Uncharacterized protein n=1 Tax=Cordylochernes scorpioides TaxID=51811 RepID=A0ABY6LNG1_9ARAC|nr:hypothetical protein LAZ67_22000734 [Cordylochernes scorpioides]